MFLHSFGARDPESNFIKVPIPSMQHALPSAELLPPMMLLMPVQLIPVTLVLQILALEEYVELPELSVSAALMLLMPDLVMEEVVKLPKAELTVTVLGAVVVVALGAFFLHN